ncbi:MAG: hypothetical protein WB424_13335 [Terracidiphilus sp.]
MRKWVLVVASLVLSLTAIVFSARRFCIAPFQVMGQSTNQPPVLKLGSALLPASEIDTYIKFYLGETKDAVQSWQPSQADLDSLERNLPQISSLKENVPGPGRHIENPEKYFRQYLAIMQSEKKKIFVNAMCVNETNDSNEWRNHLEIVYDGGNCYWQAFYDPATQKFSNLMINGLG